MPPVFCHIGYHRTGTTFLQKDVFPALSGHVRLALPWTELACIPRQLLEDPGASAEGNGWRDLRSEPFQDSRSLLISHEGLSGGVFEDRPEIAERIHARFDDTRILVCIRSQFTMFPSFYSYVYIKGGGSLPYPEFVDRAIEGGRFGYGRLIDRYREVFGQDSVRVLLYEDLRRSQSEYLETISALLDVPVPEIGARIHRNQRYTPLAVGVTRLANRWIPGSGARHLVRRAAARIERMLPDSVPERLRQPVGGDPRVEARIRAAYALSNRTLFGTLGRDPVALGYPC